MYIKPAMADSAQQKELMELILLLLFLFLIIRQSRTGKACICQYSKTCDMLA